MTSYTISYSALSTEVAQHKAELMSAVEGVLDSGRYILGPEVEGFEHEFAEYCQAKFAFGVSNGTSALHLVLRGIGLVPGDEVITVPNSFIATVSPIALAGAKPVFVDIGDDGNMDPQRLEDAITDRTRAIIPVHLTGRPAKMNDILAIAQKRNLFVLEDAAQAVGASLDGKRVGSWGHAACFSLHPLKNLHAFGDGGMITSQDPDLIALLPRLRNHGLANREQCDFWSFNSRLDSMHAAMLRIQLRYLDEWTEARRKLAFRYNDLLHPYVEVPNEGLGERCVFQTYVIKAERRNELKQYLNEHGVEALIHYETPIHLQPAAKSLGYSASDFPKTMKHVSKILSLPLHSNLSETQQDRVVELISNFYT
ncbi:MAG: cell wall biogenesis protein [Deltaproteobacteria bacterium CG11_big_fil_rev_8_21_14_0_20_42_23]|nr:MAG: cell wall biogenesis protein [Deltaproteobacteria bacterium CG11_big_fil_rev_8_21_14_0_20_42_23]PJC64562.1 MAG: DegT/DnrJ/EryC1/StrS family aminotransferase [Deltaproteobacteria bacterium CG_4_9_14_0_2_um_filter_42_21]